MLSWNPPTLNKQNILENCHVPGNWGLQRKLRPKLADRWLFFQFFSLTNQPFKYDLDYRLCIDFYTQQHETSSLQDLFIPGIPINIWWKIGCLSYFPPDGDKYTRYTGIPVSGGCVVNSFTWRDITSSMASFFLFRHY